MSTACCAGCGWGSSAAAAATRCTPVALIRCPGAAARTHIARRRAMFPKVNLRMILGATLGMALLVNYVTWLHDYPPVPEAIVTAPGNTGPGASSAPALGGSVPVLASPAASPATAAPAPSLLPPGTPAAAPDAALVHVVTDVLDVQISLAG